MELETIINGALFISLLASCELLYLSVRNRQKEYRSEIERQNEIRGNDQERRRRGYDFLVNQILSSDYRFGSGDD